MLLSDIEQGLVLSIDKPRGWSSFQVVNKIKWQIRRDLGLKKFKIGHAGTLDPLASGLLLVCVGKATKMIDELQQGNKVYTGTMVLGATTPCYDLEQAIDHFYPYDHIDAPLIERGVLSLSGCIDQVPPMFSAIKIDGARAYTYARDGQPADIAPKKVTVFSFEITDFRPGIVATEEELREAVKPDEPLPTSEGLQRELYRNPQGKVPPQLPQIDFRICCSKGTYIRSLARDLGLALGSGAFLSALRREQIGDYCVSNALTISSGEPVAL